MNSVDAKDLRRLTLHSAVRRLLHGYGIEKPPVPVQTIAKNLVSSLRCFSLRYAGPLDQDALYRLVPDGTDLLIVNQELDSPRQRFALARELLHSLARSGRLAEQGLHWTWSVSDAEYFSRCLLMPATWYVQDYTSYGAIHGSALHERYQVPEGQAMRRLHELGLASPLRILIAVASDVLETGLEQILTQDLDAHVIAKACNGEKALPLLAQHRDRAVSYDQLLDQVWGYPPEVSDLAQVRNTVKRLREKLGEDANDPPYITAVRGLGYRWVSSTNLALRGSEMQRKTDTEPILNCYSSVCDLRRLCYNLVYEDTALRFAVDRTCVASGACSSCIWPSAGPRPSRRIAGTHQ